MAATALAAAVATATGHGRPHWQVVHHGGSADLRAISPVSARVAWASGSNGTVLRTTNGGRSWQSVGPAGTSALEFRGLKAFDRNHAVLMSIGNAPGDFRTYLTADGGRHWRITNRNANPQAFYDCMAFFDRRHGLILSDPVNGRFRILITANGGRSWRIDPARNVPRAHAPNEYGFAASNECITTSGHRHAWFGSGGPAGSRVYRSADGGRTWKVSQTPLHRGASAGVFAVAFRSQAQGLAIGGDFATTGDGAARARADRRRRPHLDARRRGRRPGRLPLRRDLGAAHVRHGARRRPDRQRHHHRRRLLVDAVRRRQLRRGRVHAGRRVLGLGRERAHRPPARPLSTRSAVSLITARRPPNATSLQERPTRTRVEESAPPPAPAAASALRSPPPSGAASAAMAASWAGCTSSASSC